MSRFMPVEGGPAVPWELIEPHEKQAQTNHGQTLERLAERGGISAGEALAILCDMRYRREDLVDPQAGERLGRLIAKRLDARTESARDLVDIMSMLQRHQPAGSPPPGGRQS